MLKAIVDYTLLFLGFLFTFFVPGVFIISNFFPKLSLRIKIVLIPILSVIASTYLIYFVSLLIGLSRYSILLSFLVFCPWFINYVIKEFRIKKIINLISSNYLQLAIGICTYLLFFFALFPGIYTRHDNYIVMSSVNWQDTAMHMGIIESIAQGNFPPQAPYYAGVSLNYYYFMDFHSSILVNLFGRFFPRILIYVNPLFAMYFSLALYALAYEVSKSKIVAGISSFVGVLFGNMMFINFLKDLFVIKFNNNFIAQLSDLISSKNYSTEYKGLFQMPTMADYFLQNRPMMIGLPAITLVILFLVKGFKKYELRYILLSGVITGALIKFQYFGILIGIISYALGIIFFFNLKKLKFIFKSIFVFFIPIIFISLPFLVSTNVNNKSMVKMIIENFSFGPWEKDKNLVWFLKFDIANLNLPFLLVTFLILILIIKFIKGSKPDKITLYFLGLFLILFGIPNVINFTIYEGDMFKFFYFMLIPMVILSVMFLEKVFRDKVSRYIFITFFVFVTTFTSFLTLANSALNKNSAYSFNDEKAGLWIRKNTPQRSVFISMPTVHTPITQIGGRLRVLSYINWPYSHGYNTGDDNVFKRLKDIENVYTGASKDMVKSTIKRYNASYIFYGNEERNTYPKADDFLSSLSFLNLVYDCGGIKIYEINKNL